MTNHTTSKRKSPARRPKPQRAAIEVKGLTKVFGHRRVLDDLSFEIAWGRVTGFLGPNGAGKTSTIRAILGLLEPTSGSATVTGRRYAELEQPANVIGAVLESTWFHPRRSAQAHLRSIATAAGIGSDRVEEVLGMVDLQEHAGRRVGTFSLGMRQRLGLAAALLGEPKILVLDEPANGLDPGGIRWLRTALLQLAERGAAVFVSSHVLAEVAHIADDVVVLDRGRLVARGTVAELTGRSGDLEEAFFDLLNKEGDE